MLPSYLQYKTENAKTASEYIICSGDCRFSVLADSLIRIEKGIFTDAATLTVVNRSFASPRFTAETTNGILQIETDKLSLRYHIDQPFSNEALQIRLKAKPYTEWHFGDRPLQNLGGTVCTLDQIDGSCPIDDGVCSIDGYALLDDSKTPLFLPDGWFSRRNEPEFDFYFFGYGHDYTACVQDYYRLTGIPEMLPAYAFGNWWSRYNKYTEETYLQLMDQFRDEDVPISVGIIDMDWHLTDGDGREYVEDGWTGYTWNKALFPDPPRFLSKLKERNIHTALNLHPAAGVRFWDDTYEEMANAMGIDPQTKHPVPFDNLNPEFWKAYFEILHFPKEKDGVDFWWVDWQQGTDYKWTHVYDETINELECMDPLWMLNHMHYTASERDGKRGLFFSRYAGYGSQRYPIGFSGDSIISWESLQFQPYFTVTASNIGYSFWSHDLGGHMMGYRDDELNARWIQFGVFSPIFRIHSSNSPFTVREPWNFNGRVEPVLRSFMKLRHELFPYIYTMAYRNHKELIPTLRPMYHTNPEDKDAYTVPNEYWFGSELIAAPITEKADEVAERAHTEVWLPDGNWIDWFTGFLYKGNEKLQVYRPIEQMPLFCKAGAIVPMRKHIPHDNRLLAGESIQIVLAAGAGNSFTLYEDDGESSDYHNGISCTTEMKLDWREKEALFTVSPAQGSTDLIPQKREFTIICKGFRKSCSFFMNNEPVEADYNPTNGEYTVCLGFHPVSESVSVRIVSNNPLLTDNANYRDILDSILMRANCENSVKNTWNWIISETIRTGLMDPVQFVCRLQNNLGGSLYEILHQMIRARKPVPTPGLPKKIQ